MSADAPTAFKGRVLLVDDDRALVDTISDGLGDHGYDVTGVSTSKDAEILLAESYDVLVTDLRMPGTDGIALLHASKKIAPDRPVIVMTAHSALDSAVASIKLGAYHYLTKPFRVDELALFVERAMEESKLRREARALRRTVDECPAVDPIDDAISSEDLRHLERPIATAVAPVLPPRISEHAPEQDRVPATLAQAGAWRFWLAVIVTGLGTGLGAAALTRLLAVVQHLAWPAPGNGLLESAEQATPWRHVLVLVGAGLLTGLGQIILRRLPSGNGIDITEAISFSAGRLPTLRTLGTAVLSVVIVGMGTSLGREAAPKQTGAVLANVLSDTTKLSDEQRRLLVACGAGAGMAAAYGVPLGGALFALEVMRGALALRMVLPAILTSLLATAVSWIFLPDAPTYPIPAYASSGSIICFAVLAGPIAGVVSVGYIRAIAWADKNKPKGSWRLVAPAIVLGLLGVASIRFPQLLGNGKDIAELTFANTMTISLLVALLLLKPLATVLCLSSGAPGGLFTPSLALGALLGAVLGHAWSWVWPGAPPGLFAIVGAAAVVAATTQGPLSAIVLMMELTGRDRSFIVPLLLAVATATLVSRTLEPRSIYDARLTDEQVRARRAPYEAPAPMT